MRAQYDAIVLCLTVVLICASSVRAQKPGQLLPVMPPQMANAANPLISPLDQTDPFITETIDFRETLAKFAEAKALTAAAARIEMLQFLCLTPKRKARRNPNQAPTFELIDVDRFEITARKSFFDNLPGMMRCLENGLKQVAISCQLAYVEPKHANHLNKFLVPGSAQVSSSPLPAVVPMATAQPADKASAAGSFVMTSTVIQQSKPVTSGLISRDDFKTIQRYLRSSQITFEMSPRVTCYPEQSCKIVDGSSQPFVVALKSEHSQQIGKAVTQPVVQLVPQGTTIQLKPFVVGEQVRLLSDIAVSKIIDVQTVSYATAGGSAPHRIQIPQQNLKQIHLSTLLDGNSILMVDPNFTQIEGQGKQAKEKKLILFLQAQMISPLERTAARPPAAKAEAAVRR